jgi:signal transduction histidine kinase
VLKWAAVIAGAVSIVVSVTFPVVGARYGDDSLLALVEVGALLVLTAGAVRVAPAGLWLRLAMLPAVAVPAWLLRYGWGPASKAALGGFAAWVLVAVAAVSVGAYLRRLDAARVRSVTEARHAQRLQLARDLHDFVAHDVSGMLAQAQAGQLLAERDPAAAAAAFRRIEQAGLQALASLDRTVHMLDGSGLPPAGLADVPDLVARFGSSVDASVDLELVLPREVGATVYRVIVEALTNVRRHAPGASRVRVWVGRVGSSVVVRVLDDGPSGSGAGLGAGFGARLGAGFGRRGGLGLPGLAERVEALGGTLVAGPDPAGGWRVEASLPLAA